MNAARLAAIALLCLAVALGRSNAADLYYECTVVSAEKLTGQGTLSPHWTIEQMVGTKFTVDRVTGRIIGGPLDNSNMKIDLVDKGTHEMSFQASAQSKQNTHTTHIEVQEFVPGADKPFVGTTTLYYPGVYSGTCK